MLYGNQLIPILIRLKVSYSMLAKKLGVTQPNVSMKMKKDTWTSEELDNICDILDIQWKLTFYYKDGTEIDESVIQKNDEKLNFNTRLDFILETLGITKRELADRMGVRQSNMSRKFIYNRWKIKDIDDFCKALDILYVVDYTYKDGSPIFHVE